MFVFKSSKTSSSSKISKENKTEWRNERRAKMLSSGWHKGIKYNPGNIEAMTMIPARKIEKMIGHEVKKEEMILTGEHL